MNRTKHFFSFLALISCFLVSIGLLAQKPQVLGYNIELVESGLMYSEGPVWLDGVGLLFCDVNADEIRILNSDGSFGSARYLAPSGQSTGLALDGAGNLLLAQLETRAISRLENGQMKIIASHYNGKRLNSPNDLVVNSRGSIYFTDPKNNIVSEISFTGIYRVNPYGTVQLLDSTIRLPNGLAFSPDEKLLYVNQPDSQIIYLFDVVNDSVLSGKRVFHRFQTRINGMKVDSSGFVYTAASGEISIIAPDKTSIKTIRIPGVSTNIAFGNSDRKTLYITAGTQIFRVADNPLLHIPSGNNLQSNPILGTYTDGLTNILRIPLQINSNAFINLEVRSITGNTIAIIAKEFMNVEKRTFNWDFNHVTDGLYLLHLTIDDKSVVTKINLNKN